MSGKRAKQQRKARLAAEDEQDRPPEQFRFKPRSSVPDWAHFFTLTEFLAFLRAVEKSMWERYAWFEEDGDVIRLHTVDDEHVTASLREVATACCAASPDQYPAIVEKHFTGVLGPPIQTHTGRAPKLKEIASLLRVRIYTDAYMSAHVPADYRPVTRRLAPNVNATVVAHVGNGAMIFNHRQAKELDVDENRLFETATANHTTERVRIEPVRFRDCEAFSLFSESHYGCSQILHLQRHLDRPAPWGAVVALLHRDFFMATVIDPRTVNDGLIGLVHMAHVGYQDYRDHKDPGLAMSPHIFWWRPDHLEQIPAMWSDEAGATIMPSEAFLETIFPSPSLRPNQLGGNMPV